MNCVIHVHYCFIYWLYITALLEDCTNKQYKCVLYCLHETHYFYLLYYVFIKIINADNLHLCNKKKKKNIYCILWGKEWPEAQFKFLQHGASFVMYTVYWYGTNIMHYWWIIVLKPWWLMLNVIPFFFFTVSVK